MEWIVFLFGCLVGWIACKFNDWWKGIDDSNPFGHE